MYLSIGIWVIIISCMAYLLFVFGRVNYRTNQRTVSKVGDVDTEITSDGNDNPAATSPSSNDQSSTNWGGIVAGIVAIAILIGALFIWSPWSDNNFSPAISEVDREMMAQGYVEVSYSSIGGDLYIIHWEKLPDFHGGDTIDFYNVEFDGNRTKKWKFKTNSFTPRIVKKGTTLHLADGEKMPKKLYAKIIKK